LSYLDQRTHYFSPNFVRISSQTVTSTFVNQEVIIGEMIRHLIFDFDGVIADTFDMNWALIQEHDEAATVDDFIAHHDQNVFEDPRIKFKPERVEEYHSEYRKRLTPSHIEKATGPLRRLGAQYQLYVVSSNGEKAINAILEQSGTSELFARIMGAETHKSKAEKFRMLMAEYAVTPENALFITDTLGDIREAHRVGLRTIAETFGYHDRARLALGEPYRLVDTWDELERAIASA
jgi:phosphoglycolate phosphatase